MEDIFCGGTMRTETSELKTPWVVIQEKPHHILTLISLDICL